MRAIERPHTAPWHAGEIAIQASLGVAARMEEVGRKVIRDHLIEQHQAFFPLLPFVVLGAVDQAGDAWATIRAGEPGFLQAPDAMHLAIAMQREGADPAEAGLEDGDAVGLLGIELSTRRRNRLNGTVRRSGPDGFAIAVEQSYGNCPKYIAPRQARFARDRNAAAPPPVVSHALDDRARAMVAGADTFFVASSVDLDDGQRQVDVSHRGGPSGFVRIGADGVLTIPDFAGNRFFNTLGNISTNPRTGLVFVDFETGDRLQMTGRADVVLASPEIATLPGAERLWRFAPKTIVFSPGALALCFSPA